MQITDKILEIEDVQLLNAEKNSKVILKNTVGQKIDVIRQLSPDVTIQIIGGYDGDKKSKYKERRIQSRTIYKPSQVCDIISKFEEYESGIDASWSDLEKAVYIYKKFATNIVYHEDDVNASRNLNTVLGKGVCAGYSIVFKEAMDRLGIKCDIINEPRVHTWNAIQIEDNWYPLDLTWDANNIQNKGADSIIWFGQNPAFSKYNNHQARGEEPIPNNCFEPQAIADALNKVENTNKYQPANQEEKIGSIFSNILNLASQSDSSEAIMDGIRYLAEFAFKVGDSYNDDAYTQEFDQKFGDIFIAIRGNENLTDEQKSSLLRSTNNTWSDVMGKILFGGIRKSQKWQMWDSLKSMQIMLNNGDYYSVDNRLIEAQLQDVYKKCTSYGVVDFEKTGEMAKQINQQALAMRRAKEKKQDIGTLDTQIRISGPIQIIGIEPLKEPDMKSWASHQIVEYETFLNGINESGESVEDEETKEIITICKQQLDSFRAFYNQLSQEHIQGR